jgi:hypothetical protein
MARTRPLLGWPAMSSSKLFEWSIRQMNSEVAVDGESWCIQVVLCFVAIVLPAPLASIEKSHPIEL